MHAFWLFVVQLALEKDLNLKSVKFFVIDECDKVLEKLGEWCLSRFECS